MNIRQDTSSGLWPPPHPSLPGLIAPRASRPAHKRTVGRRSGSHRRPRPVSHDQNFKNLVIDYPKAALAFFSPQDGIALDDDAVIIPIRQELPKRRLHHRFFEMDTPLRVSWPSGEREDIVFIIEEDSTPSRFSPARLLHYCTGAALAEKTSRVVAVVIFLKRGKIVCEYEMRVESGQSVRFQYRTCQLATLHAGDYAESPNIVARITSVCMGYPNTTEAQVRVYGQAIKGLLELEPDTGLRIKYLDFIESYLRLDAHEWRVYEQLYSKENPQMSLFAQRWIEKGREEGMQSGFLQGRQEGILLGEERGQRIMLARQLTRRFGPLPTTIEARIQAASLDELDHWGDRLFSAQSLEEIFRLQ